MRTKYGRKETLYGDYVFEWRYGIFSCIRMSVEEEGKREREKEKLEKRMLRCQEDRVWGGG